MVEESFEPCEILKKAQEFHGHLGPFLVIGVKLGEFAKKKLGENMNVLTKVPFITPFSCIIDGVQVATKCTVGNRKLLIEDSNKEIIIQFKQGSKNVLKVHVKPQLIEKLVQDLSQGVPAEELAHKIALMPESQIFTVKKNK
ncbi:MAG: FmdE family protein [Candidatus Bathyarchaeia archaeon]